jgi:hypothetical protein
MKNIKPIIDGYCVYCPAYNGEWMICTITKTKCPTVDEDIDTVRWSVRSDGQSGFIVKY